jgi:predicted thioredoxin/glutaredoxin
MIVFVEPDCVLCERVLETVAVLREQDIVADIVIFDRSVDPESCMKFGVFIFPAVYIDGQLAFYGEFSIEDAKRFINHRSHSSRVFSKGVHSIE